MFDNDKRDLVQGAVCYESLWNETEKPIKNKKNLIKKNGYDYSHTKSKIHLENFVLEYLFMRMSIPH